MGNTSQSSIVEKELQKLLEFLDIKDLEYEIFIKKKKENKPYSRLKDNHAAVYLFFNESVCLKVGKAGMNAKARYQSHHYYYSTKSTLANSILLDRKELLDEEQVTQKIRKEFERIDILISSNNFDLQENSRKLDDFISLVEQYFIYEFNPKYEGRK